MKILDAGLLTTIQDLGRPGHQRHGVAPGGALDQVAMRCANALVGNPQDRAGLEITFSGPTIEFEHDALIAICGADLSASIADVLLPTWESVWVQRGAVLGFGDAEWGCRAYLAVAGGIEVEEVLGSRSTYLSAGFGGLGGRPLRAGDVVPTHPTASSAIGSFEFGPRPFSRAGIRIAAPVEELYGSQPIRFIPGPEYDMLERHPTTFESATFCVSSASDRVGYRLEGPVITARRSEIPSAATVTGAVQLPGGGQPVVLMSEHQTTGGYPVIAAVASVDLPLLAQLRPGDGVRLTEVTREDAVTELRERRDKLEVILRQVESVFAG